MKTKWSAKYVAHFQTLSSKIIFVELQLLQTQLQALNWGIDTCSTDIIVGTKMLLTWHVARSDRPAPKHYYVRPFWLIVCLQILSGLVLEPLSVSNTLFNRQFGRASMSCALASAYHVPTAIVILVEPVTYKALHSLDLNTVIDKLSRR